jgi:hypothetical protein
MTRLAGVLFLVTTFSVHSASRQSSAPPMFRGRVTDAHGWAVPGVADANGFPLPFAVVDVQQLSGTRIYRGRYLRSYGYADEAGQYSVNVPAGHHQVRARNPGYVAVPRDARIALGKKVALNLTASESGSRTSSMESLRSIANCGKLGFRKLAPVPTPVR